MYLPISRAARHSLSKKDSLVMAVCSTHQSIQITEWNIGQRTQMSECQNCWKAWVNSADALIYFYSGIEDVGRNALLFARESVALRTPSRHYFDPPRWVLVRATTKTPPGKACTNAQHEKIAPRSEHRNSRALSPPWGAQRRSRGAFLMPFKKSSAGSDSR